MYVFERRDAEGRWTLIHEFKTWKAARAFIVARYGEQALPVTEP